MNILPKSRKARRRLMIVGLTAPILGVGVALSLYAMGDAAVFFYTPSQAAAKQVPAGRTIRVGGLVEAGSLRRSADGTVAFTITDRISRARIEYHGALPDLFREGQGVVAQGAFRDGRIFVARDVLAKHDERYMPKEVADALKKSGEWRGSDASNSKAPS